MSDEGPLRSATAGPLAMSTAGADREAADRRGMPR